MAAERHSATTAEGVVFESPLYDYGGASAIENQRESKNFGYLFIHFTQLKIERLQARLARKTSIAHYDIIY